MDASWAQRRRHHPAATPSVSLSHRHETLHHASPLLTRRTTNTQRHAEAVWGVAFNPLQPTQLASGAEDGTVLVSNVGPFIG